VRGEGRGARGLVLHLQLLSTGIEGYYEVLASGAQARWRRRYRGMLGRGSGQAGRPKEVHGVSRAGSRDRRGAVWHDASGIINARPGWEKLWECSTQYGGTRPWLQDCTLLLSARQPHYSISSAARGTSTGTGQDKPGTLRLRRGPKDEAVGPGRHIRRLLPTPE
jgi:hypothetical protein